MGRQKYHCQKDFYSFLLKQKTKKLHSAYNITDCKPQQQHCALRLMCTVEHRLHNMHAFESQVIKNDLKTH